MDIRITAAGLALLETIQPAPEEQNKVPQNRNPAEAGQLSNLPDKLWD